MMKSLSTTLLTLILLVAPLQGQQEDPAALIIRVQGAVRVERGGSSAPAAVGERLFDGDRVLPDPGARAILITAAGTQQVVTEATTMRAPSGVASSDMFARAVATLAQAATADASAGGRQGMIRPIPGKTSLVSPRNELNISSPRPTFHWTRTPGQSYELMLRKVDGGRPQIFEVGQDTTWTLPPEAADLEHGARYAWTVFVGGRRGGRPVEQQQFRVISLEESVDLQDYLDEISVFGLDPMGDGLFLTVVAYRDLDLFYEANGALEEVERSADLTADLYRLKGEILSELGHEEEARAAFDRASESMR